MTVIFSPNPVNNLVMMQAESADNHAGELVSWRQVAGYLQPSGNTWTRALSGELIFNFDIAVEGEYKILARQRTAGRDAWLWFDIDGNKQAVGPRNFGRLKYNTVVWRWQGSADNVVTLGVGRHVLKVRGISSALQLDKIAVAPIGSADIGLNTTSLGPNDIKTGEREIITESYSEWIKNPLNEPYRALLVELDNQDDTVRFSSQAWMSDEGLPYYLGIIGRPFLEDNIGESVGVGDLVVKNPKPELVNWLNQDWRGYRCRWYYGDIRWRKRDFKKIASATIEACRPVGTNTYQFDLLGDAQLYKRTFWQGEDLEQTLTIENAIKWILNQYENSGSLQFINIPEDLLDKEVKFVSTESTEMLQLIEDICVGIRALPRMSQTGFLEIVRADKTNEPAIEFNIENVLKETLVTQETIYPVTRVRVSYNLGEDFINEVTDANTGTLDEEVVIATLFAHEADAQEFALEMAEQYTSIRRIWSAEIVNVSDLLQVVDAARIVHNEVVGVAVVNSVKRTPLSKIGSIEITL